MKTWLKTKKTKIWLKNYMWDMIVFDKVATKMTTKMQIFLINFHFKSASYYLPVVLCSEVIIMLKLLSNTNFVLHFQCDTMHFVGNS